MDVWVTWGLDSGRCQDRFSRTSIYMAERAGTRECEDRVAEEDIKSGSFRAGLERWDREGQLELRGSYLKSDDYASLLQFMRQFDEREKRTRKRGEIGV